MRDGFRVLSSSSEMEFSSSPPPKARGRRGLTLLSLLACGLLLAILLAALLLFVLPAGKKGFSLDASDEHKLLSSLINIPSVSGSEGEMGEAIFSLLKSKGWTVIKQATTATTFNVFAHRGNPNPRLLINSHLDTVAPYIAFSEDSQNIYGRGACDAKGSIVAQLFAVDQLLEEGLDPSELGLLYVVEEETTSLGMKKANELGLTPSFLIVGEPTERKLGAGHKGSLSFVVESFGKEAHSGYPELGVSAISPLLALLAEFEQETWPYDSYFGQSTLNIGMVQGGVGANVVPAYANASVFIRVTIPSDEVKVRVEEMTKQQNPNFTLVYKAETNPFRCDIVPGFETEIFSFGTDLPQFKGSHKSYLFGPGSILVAHTPSEYISKQDLTAAIGDYKRLIKEVLAQP